MLRESILDLLKDLNFNGMRAACDEILAAGQRQGHTAEKLMLNLLEAE
jgi:hypothetical protein